jgi:hypothetical protein
MTCPTGGRRRHPQVAADRCRHTDGPHPEASSEGFGCEDCPRVRGECLAQPNCDSHVLLTNPFLADKLVGE